MCGQPPRCLHRQTRSVKQLYLPLFNCITHTHNPLLSLSYASMLQSPTPSLTSRYSVVLESHLSGYLCNILLISCVNLSLSLSLSLSLCVCMCVCLSGAGLKTTRILRHRMFIHIFISLKKQLKKTHSNT